MDISCRIQIFILISLHFLLSNHMIRANLRSSKLYYLTKNCRSQTDNSDYVTKLKLNINLTGAFIKSHSGYSADSADREGYPDNFFCEIVAEAAKDHIIMLLIESLHIPGQNSLCDENYLYVFDYKSSRSKAMTSAGGEKGLCGKIFPRFPIFTTGPYITIVFKSNLRDSFIPHDAGFQLTLTQVQQTDKNNPCKAGHYQCAAINFSSMSSSTNEIEFDAAAFQKQEKPLAKSNSFSPVTMARQSIPKRSMTPIVNYCIPFDVICDGVKNCHDGSDEDASAQKWCLDLTNKSIINRFLSLGLSASIAIAVSCTIAVTLCIGVTVCYCMKLCTSRLQPRQSQFTKGVNAGSDYQPANSYPPIYPVNQADTYCSPYIANQSSQFVCIKARPASEKICHWTSSSMASYPSTSEGHHSHPETPYFKRETAFGEHSPHRNENKYRSSNPRGHNNSYTHHTPTSSRSAKSTRSTKSSHIDKKSLQKNGSNSQNHSHKERFRKYPAENNRIMVLGPVLGEL